MNTLGYSVDMDPENKDRLQRLTTAFVDLPVLDPLDRAKEANRLIDETKAAMSRIRQEAIYEASRGGVTYDSVADWLGISRAAVNKAVVGHRARMDASSATGADIDEAQEVEFRKIELSPTQLHKFRARSGAPDPVTGCMVWRCNTQERYARFSVNGRGWYVHQVAYALAHESLLPANLVVRHTCDNTRCVRPDHLMIGTQADNNRDRWMRGRYVATTYGAQRKASTRCTRDHEYTPENTRWYRGGRRCKTCLREDQRAYYQRQKEKQAPNVDAEAS